ncbi:MAG: glycoside hydrolase [Chloroflexota bacterium]|nr:glycoside hydrolase [Chloroflexota bacterium]MDQ2960051.1 glycoside hydrolase [Candidatus Dormibacteraeota bacterium]
MRKRVVLVLTALAMMAVYLSFPSTPASAEDSLARRAATGALKPATVPTAQGPRTLPSLSGGVIESAKEQLAQQAPAGGPQQAASEEIRRGTLGCRARNPDRNVRVNQDCTFRRQAEESIAFNPIDHQNLIAGQNDSRIGFNHCGYDFSLDGGRSWGDGIPPFYQRLNGPTAGHTLLGGAGTGHTYDAASDPALAFDSAGTAYFGCVVFDINSAASALLVTASPSYANGSFYNNVPSGGTSYVVVEDNNAKVFHDKPFIAADSFATSPFRDSVYATWTVFKQSCGASGTGYCSSPIYFARSTDHGVTWSTPKEISGTSPTLCSFGNFFDPTADPNACNFDQGSQPIVRPNGDLVVVFNNGNTAAGDPNSQQLAVVSKDGGATWSAPTLVGADVTVGEPQCNFGRGLEECIPGAFVRTNDFPRLAVNRIGGNLYAAWQDYRTGTFEIHLSTSTDGGATWHEAKAPVNPNAEQDRYEPAIDVVPNGAGGNGAGGDHVAVSYYQTGRVPNENATPAGGFAAGQPGVQRQDSRYMLAGGRQLTTPYAEVAVSPMFPPPDGNQAGFLGDYSGLIVVDNRAHPIWADTRNAAPADQGLTHDEDIFTDALVIPDQAANDGPPVVVPGGRSAPGASPAPVNTPNPVPTGR